MSTDNKEDIRLSKFLSLVLRHKPEVIGIQLDENGWTDVATLLEKAKATGVNIDLVKLQHLVETNNKQRFSFSNSGLKIRASQGHSVNVDLNYQPQVPPPILYHGTAIRFLEAILATGLQKRNRHHVHLSTDSQTALQVGKRHGKPVVLEILALNMYNAGFTFFISENSVWLTEEVPPAYLRLSPIHN